MSGTSLTLYAVARSWTQNGLANAGPVIDEELNEDRKRDTELPIPLPHSHLSQEEICPLSRTDSKVRKRNLESALSESCSRKEGEPSGSELMHAKDLLGLHVQHAKRIRVWNEERRMHRINRFQPRYKQYLPVGIPAHSQHVIARANAAVTAKEKISGGPPPQVVLSKLAQGSVVPSSNVSAASNVAATTSTSPAPAPTSSARMLSALPGAQEVQ